MKKVIVYLDSSNNIISDKDGIFIGDSSGDLEEVSESNFIFELIHRGVLIGYIIKLKPQG